MGIYVLIIASTYFILVFLISYLTSRGEKTNNSFFLGNRKAPWYVIAIGMLGDSISGVTFISVPGMVRDFDMSYMQMVLGFFPGYLLVAFILLPLYYKLNLTSIYGYLNKRFGRRTYKTGSVFFILSRLVGSAAKLYLVALVLQVLVFDEWEVPFVLTVSGIVVLIWLYTFRSGIRTIIWTDALQTTCLLLALALIIWQVVNNLNISWGEAYSLVKSSEHSRIFVFDDWASKQHFAKQFLSGILIVIVMTGLDQNMMQKNLACKNLRDAQKNMLSYGFGFIPLNFLFLALGILLLAFANQFGIELPSDSDQILPILATDYLGSLVFVFFIIGIIAASFSNADSAMASITTSVCVDLLDTENKGELKAKRTRFVVHIIIALAFIAFVMLISYLGEGNILNTIYRAASYTYGPLLGLYALGLFTELELKDKWVPIVCLLAPILSYALEGFLLAQYNYVVGYEILLANGLITALGLSLIRDNKKAGLNT